MNKFLLVGLLIFSSFHSFSQKYWDRGSSSNSSWADPLNWAPDGVPSSTDDVFIDAEAFGAAISSVSISASTIANCRNLTIVSHQDQDIFDDFTAVLQVAGTLNIAGNLEIKVNYGGVISRVNLRNGSTTNLEGNVIFTSTSAADALLDMTQGTGNRTLNIKGNVSQNTVGTIASNQYSTINLLGASPQILNLGQNITYNNINIIKDNITDVVTMNGAITNSNVRGNINITKGILNNNESAIIGNINAVPAPTVQNTFTVGNEGTLQLKGTTGLPVEFGSLNFLSGSFIEYSGTDQTINSTIIPNYSNLRIAGSGIKTISNGDLTIANTLELAENTVVNFNNSTSKIVMTNGAGNALISAGATYINGTLQRNISETGTNYVFPVGNGIEKKRLDLNFSALNGLTDLTVNFVQADPLSHPQTSSVNPQISGDATLGEIAPENGYFHVVKNNGAGAPAYNISLYPTTFPLGEAFAIAKRATGGTVWEVPGTINPNNTGDGILTNGEGNQYIQQNGLSDFSDITPIGSPTPFPVDLKSFHAKLVEDYVQLDWVTLSETKSSHFVIERSRDSHSFDSIGTVLSAGNSSERLEYNFADLTATDILAKVLYYRLKQVDVDGQSKTYPMVGVDVEDIIRNSKIKIFPNPATVDVTVASYLKEDVHLDIYNPLGKVVDQKEISSEKTTIDTSNLEAGVYVFKFINGSTVINKKVIVK